VNIFLACTLLTNPVQAQMAYCVLPASKVGLSLQNMASPPQGEQTVKSNIDAVENGIGNQSLARAKEMGFL
jgi:hypothetical protein